MKLLMIYCDQFGYRPVSKTLEEFPDITEEGIYENALVAF